ncbi:MAG: hydrogenase maturation protease [Candidatus Goldbacteria bacterium]|nr:hydrogenase maturation protease [Candidatus Goldiibacteriota bacterium]
MKILIYGYGNPGRQDDGVGNFFVNELKKWAEKKKIKHIFFDSNYQLNIEDSLEITKYDLIIFVDAAKNVKNGYNFNRIYPEKINFYTMHKIMPENILFLSKELYNKEPVCYLLTIKGYKWEINKTPTKKAIKNVKSSMIYVKKYIKALKK